MSRKTAGSRRSLILIKEEASKGSYDLLVNSDQENTMVLKDLLVHVDDSKGCPGRVQAAIGLAQAYEAHLTALYVMPLINIPAYAEAQIPFEVIQAQKKAAQAQASKAEKSFADATKKARLSSEWRCVEDDFAHALSLQARYVDLVISGQEDRADPLSIPGLTARVVMEAGSPVLAIPYIGAAATLGERVLIAWNASREAVRAIHDAMPLLERAKSVTVLSINPPGGPSADGHVPGADIALHLARHGVRAEADHVEAHDIAVGDMLLSRAADKGVDLIVMGAYGHSRFRELVLGGATRHLLQHMTVPVLMTH
jgi:nucleotide-binding universal stress UspA family protein